MRKIGKEKGLQLNVWDSAHMNKIVPAYLFNMQERWGKREGGRERAIDGGWERKEGGREKEKER